MLSAIRWILRMILIFELIPECSMTNIVSIFYNAKPSVVDTIEMSLDNGVIRNTTGTEIRCGMSCAGDSSCYSFIAHGDRAFCQIFDRILRKIDSPSTLTGALYYQKEISTCPAGYTLSNGWCFKYFNVLKTWNQAQTICQQHGGFIFHVSSWDRQHFLQQSLNVGSDFHIGGLKENGNWIWSNEKPLSEGYQNWGPQEPTGDCLKIQIKSLPNSSPWKNFDCDTEQLKFLCEIYL